MRGKFLGAIVLALASVTFWSAAIPFAADAPVAVAYSTADGQGAAVTPSRMPIAQTFTTVAGRDGGLADYSLTSFVWRGLILPQPTDTPVDPTASPVPLQPTDEPTDQPTDKPDQTGTPVPNTPDPTATPRPEPTVTPRPEPTATAQPTRTPEPTAVPTPTRTPEPTRSASPTRTPEPTRTPSPTRTPEPTQRPTATPSPTRTPEPTVRPTATPSPTPKPTLAPTPEPTPQPTNPPQTYAGKSRFWFPALNIDASWGWYGCDYGGPDTMPGGIWRWGCGPSSNVYLLSHAWSTFKKIRTAFHQGTLQVGQNVWYANGNGDVTKWEIKWIRRVTAEYLNSTAGDWALNDSPTPIMTLQTCDGAQSQLRIIVRLVPAN